MEDMENIPRRNVGSTKADFRQIMQDVQDKDEALIVQRNNVDQIAMVTLEMLALALAAKRKNGRKESD